LKPKVFPAPSFTIEYSLSHQWGPPRPGLVPAYSRFEEPPESLKPYFSNKDFDLISKNWDSAPFACTFKNAPDWEDYGDIDSFSDLISKFPNHLQVIERTETEACFNSNGKPWDEHSSHRVDFLSLNHRPKCWDVFEELGTWLGVILHDYWFYTPPNTSSVPVHADSQNNLIVQVVGTKKWKLYPPLYPSPVYGAGKFPIKSSDLKEGECVEYELHPGDVLFLPRGVPHLAETTDTASFHLDLNLIMPSRLNLLTQMLMRIAVEHWDDGTLLSLSPLGKDIQSVNDLLRDMLSQSELTCLNGVQGQRVWWQWAVESDFEQRTPVKTNRALGESGMCSRFRFYKRYFSCVVQDDSFLTQGRGCIVQFPIEFYKPFMRFSRDSFGASSLVDLKRYANCFSVLQELDWLVYR
jgi:hypothetical protein